MLESIVVAIGVGLVYIVFYFFMAWILPFLLARLLLVMVPWSGPKASKRKWLVALMVAILWITYPVFNIVADIEGRVVDTAGQPIEGVLVTALWQEYHTVPILYMHGSPSPRNGRVVDAKEAVTDKDGRFHFSGFISLQDFLKKMRKNSPRLRFYKGDLRVDYKLSKYSENKIFFESGIYRKSRWDGLDVVMVEMDDDKQRGQASSKLRWFSRAVLGEDSCLWVNIPIAITSRYKTVKKSIWISGDTVEFGGHSLPRSMGECGVDISFFEGLDEWNIKIVQ